MSITMKKKDAGDTSQKSEIEPTLKCTQILVLVIFDNHISVKKPMLLRIKRLLLVIWNLLRFGRLKLWLA